MGFFTPLTVCYFTNLPTKTSNPICLDGFNPEHSALTLLQERGLLFEEANTRDAKPYTCRTNGRVNTFCTLKVMTIFSQL